MFVVVTTHKAGMSVVEKHGKTMEKMIPSFLVSYVDVASSILPDFRSDGMEGEHET